MDNISQLLIRACKSKDPTRRLKSVYRRFYGSYGEHKDLVAISHLLVHLVDEVCPMKLAEYLRDVSRLKSYHEMDIICRKKDVPLPEEDPAYLTTLYIMRDKLRIMMKDELVELGVRTPAKWRNK